MRIERHACRMVSDGLEALELLKTGFTPTLIMCDLNMPRLSGKEFLVERAKLNLAPNARVLMLSATPEKNDTLKVDAWLRKPVDVDQLIEAIAKYGQG